MPGLSPLKPMKMPAIFFVMILLFAGANFYVFYRLWHLAPPIPAVRWVVLALGILATACIFLYFLMGEGASPMLKGTIYKVGTSWIMIFLYLIIAFLLLDLLRVTKLVPMEWLSQGSWSGFGLVALGIAFIMGIGNIVYNNKKRVELNVAANIETPLKIVGVSDLHLGYGIGAGELSGWVDLINSEKPDIVLIAGDAIDTHVRPLYEQDMASVLRRLDAPLGVYAVPGNHEYIAGIEKSEPFFPEAGITLLKDRVVPVSGIYIAGRDDLSNPSRRPLSELTAGLGDKPVIVVDHQPNDLKEAEESGALLQLSGHTHHGQVWPISWITDAIFEKAYGYKKRGDTHYYISSGLGIWGGKFRIGSRSEYVVINLVPEG